jgi:hypothetical protein
MVNSATELGRIIGKAISSQTDLQNNISPNEFDSLLSTYDGEEVVLQLVLTATKKVAETDTFQLDHPVKGELDSSVLKLDGGYDDSQEEVLYSYTA